MHKRIFALICAAAMLCISCTARAESAALPVRWDMDTLYESEAEWQADYDRADMLMRDRARFAGRLSDARTIYDYFASFYMGELPRLRAKLRLYANLGYRRCPSEAQYARMMQQLSEQDGEFKLLNGASEAEIYALPLSERQRIFADPVFEPYIYAFREFLDPARAALDASCLEAAAAVQSLADQPLNIYNALTRNELPEAEITMPDGSVRILDDALYSEIMCAPEYARAFRLNCYQARLRRWTGLKNTFAALLNAHALQSRAMAQLRGFDSPRAAAMSADDVDTSVYDLAIAAAHAGLDDYRRYLKAHARGRGFERQYAFELSESACAFVPDNVSYETALEDITQALALLGDEYAKALQTIIRAHQIDVYPAAGKPTASCTLSAGDEYLPFIMLSFTGTPDSVCTLAHELGHAVYAMLSASAQPPVFENASVLTQETAAILNEMLYCRYKIQNSQNAAEKLYYTEYQLKLFSDDFFAQALYAELENMLYERADSGNVITSEYLDEIWTELYKKYYGDALIMCAENRSQWTMLPQLYYNNYLYNYAAAVCCAAALCEGLTDGGAGQNAAYADMLTQGSSRPPAKLLEMAGANPADEAVYRRALEYYRDLTNEYERLIAG